MKNWKLLAVFGLIAALFVFAGCIAGTTTPEETATPTVAPTAAPTATPTQPWAPAPIITNFLDGVVDDGYLNIEEASANRMVGGTAPENSEVFVYINGSVVATAKTDATGNWSAVVTSDELQALTDGEEYTISAKYSLDNVNVGRATLSEESNTTSFTVDFTAPSVVSSSGKAGTDAVAGAITDTLVNTSTDMISAITEHASCSIPDDGIWYVTAGDLDNDGVADDVRIYNAADPTNAIEIYSVYGTEVTVTLPGSNNVVDISFNNGPYDAGSVNKVEVGGCTAGVPGYITVNFNEDVTLNDATLNFWVDNDLQAFTAVHSITNNVAEPLIYYHSTWVFEESVSRTNCDLGRQYSGTFQNFVDRAGNSTASDIFQGVFVP